MPAKPFPMGRTAAGQAAPCVLGLWLHPHPAAAAHLSTPAPLEPPSPGIAIILLGAPGGGRTVSSGVSGHFEFDDLAPAKYAVRMGPPSTRGYSANPRSVAVALGANDRTGINFIVTPR